MESASQLSLGRIRRVAERLGSLRGRVVFLGGAVTSLLLTDPAAPEVRFTEDVDVVVSTASYREHSQLEEELRKRGFTHAGEIICRWNIDNITVDVMPAGAQVLGFSNRWYLRALQTAIKYALGEGLTILLITAPYFVATKLEAFQDPQRAGSGDYIASRDIADVIAVLDGRAELVSEIAAADAEVRLFLSRFVQQLLKEADFLESLDAHLLPDDASQQRKPLLIRRLEEIVSIA